MSAVLALWGADAVAQTCRGGAPIDRTGPGLFRAAVSADDEGQGVDVEAGGGSPALFGTAGFGIRRYSGPGATTFDVRFAIGGQVAATSARTLMLCPIGTVRYENADGVLGRGIDALAVDAVGGLSAGVALGRQRPVQIVPTAGLFAGVRNIRGSGLFDTLNGTDAIRWIEVGVGVVGRRTAIVPVFTQSLAAPTRGRGVRVTVSRTIGGR